MQRKAKQQLDNLEVFTKIQANCRKYIQGRPTDL